MDVVDFFDKTVDQLPSPRAKFAASAHGTGKDGGRTINLHQFAKDGVVLLDHIKNVHADRIVLVSDLMENLAKEDKFETNFVREIDNYIERNGLDAPFDPLPELSPGYEAEEILEFDLKSAGVPPII